MRYTDFVLLATAGRVVRAEDTKRLTFSLLAPGIVNDPLPRELDATVVGALKDKAGRPDSTWKDARLLGEALAAALLPDDVWSALNTKIAHAAAAQEGVRVRLMLSGSELNKWPWEFMVFNRAGGETKVSDFLALMPNVSLVRHTATPLPAWRVEAKLPAKVLIAVASPSGGAWPKLAVENERRAIEEALAGSAQLSVTSVEHARRSQLPDRLKPAHVFHFAGHGKFDKVQSPIPGAYEGKASILLEDDDGNEDPLDADLLAVQLRDAGVRVAVLGACQTAQRDDLGAWSSVAEALLKAELGAVVGMQFPIRDTAALCFAQRFYSALAVGLSIDEAVAAGRVAVACSGDARGWATPVLYLRSPDGVLFPEFGAFDDRTIVNIGPEGVRAIVKALMESQAVDPTSVQAVTRRSAPKAVSRQINAVVTAERKLAAGGAALDAEAAYRLGMLAAYGRDYEAALGYFRQATQADPDYRKAFAALSWLQQSRAMSDLNARDFDSVATRLAEAREAAMHTDPLSASDLAQRGYIYKTLAQVAESGHQKADAKKYYQEAGRLFEQAAKLDPQEAGAQNGLANVLHASGDLDGAIAAYRRAIKLAPDYTAAHHDLALAFEDKAKVEPSAAKAWRKRALDAWQKAYSLAPSDPGFSADDVLAIGRRIDWLRHLEDD